MSINIESLSDNKKSIIELMDKQAPTRAKWIKKNRYYYRKIVKFLKYHIPDNSSILEIGCGNGFLINSLNPSRGVGIDISKNMILQAKSNYPHLDFYQMDAENMQLEDKFEYVVLTDTIGYFEDVQGFITELHKVITTETRIIIVFQNFLWQPLFKVATLLKLKMPSRKLNWLNFGDIHNLLSLSDIQLVKEGRSFLLPVNIPIISWFLNKFVAPLPLFEKLCFMQYIVARQHVPQPSNNKLYSVSVIIPAQNEKGNIENAIKRLPKMGSHTEAIFIEGNSSDGTYEEMKRVAEKYSDTWDIKVTKQDGKGKGDAVRKGFNMATGDLLILLDSDLAVAPEDMPKFYNALATGKAEYINGSRLVYPMEDKAMRLLNLLANKFFSIIFTWLLGQELKDTLCGTKAISQTNWKHIVANRKYFGDFDPFGDFDLLFGASKLDLKFIEIPIRYRAREYGDIEIKRFQHGCLLVKMVFFALHKIKFI